MWIVPSILYYLLTLYKCNSDLYQLHILFGRMFIQSYIYSVFPQRKAALKQRLSDDITDQDRRQLQGELEEVEEKIKECVSRIQWYIYEERIHAWQNVIAETRGGAEKRQRKEGEGSKELHSAVSVDAHGCNHSYTCSKTLVRLRRKLIRLHTNAYFRLHMQYTVFSLVQIFVRTTHLNIFV